MLVLRIYIVINYFILTNAEFDWEDTNAECRDDGVAALKSQ